MKKQAAILLLTIPVFLISSSGVFAARKISITSDKPSIALDEEMTITASTSGFTDGEKIYLKGAFYKEGSSNYFGFTKFNDSWIKNSETSKSQREVTIGGWDNSVVVKLDYDDTGYTGVGDYKFKLGFYYLTSGGNISSVNWSTNSLDVSIENEPALTPQPEDEDDTSSENGDEGVDYTPTPRSNQTISTAKVQKNAVKSVKIANAKDASQYAEIKPIAQDVKKEGDLDKAQVLGSKESIFPKFCIAFGGFILAFAAFIFIKRELKERKIL